MSTLDYSYKAFEALVTYAVDEISDGQSFSILKDIDFDENSFYEEVYVKRERKENEIEMELRKHQCQIIIIGHPGTGKTTILHKILNKLKNDQNAFVTFIDFKIVNEANALRDAGYENIGMLVKDKIKEDVKSYLSIVEKISDFDVIDSFVHSSSYITSKYFNNPKFTEMHRELFNLYALMVDDKANKSFEEWYDYQRKSAKNDEFLAIYKRMANVIEAHNYLYYISKLSKHAPRLSILCFDNVDSILDNKIRDSFREFGRQYPSVIKESTKVIMAIRTGNPTMQQWTDTGAYITAPIEIGYEEFINDKSYEKEVNFIMETKGYVTQDDKMIIKKELLRYAIEKFAKEICQKRINYFNRPDKRDQLKKSISTSGKGIVDEKKMKMVQECFNLLLSADRIRPAFFELCNYNRREMLIAINNFTLYLIEDIRIDLEDINFDKSKHFIIESYFYGWVFNNRNYLQPELYNFAMDLAAFKNSDVKIGCSIDHLILAAIFNLSGQVRFDFSFDKTVKIKSVVNKLVELGFEKEMILEKILSLYKDKISGRPKGLLELSRFWEIQETGDLSDDDELCLTPKSFFLVCQGCMKFISLLSSLKFAKYRSKDIVFEYEDRLPITKYNIRIVFEFLHELGNMHLDGLEKIKQRLSPHHGDTWLIYYKRTFCIRPSGKKSAMQDPADGLLFSNVVNSIILFLKHQQSISNDGLSPITDDIITVFEDLTERYDEEVVKIIEGSEDRKNLSISNKTLSLFA